MLWAFSPIESQWLEGESRSSEERQLREQMARQYPSQPIIGVGAVIISDGKVLLVRRANPPRKDEWSLPGGAQRIGEPIHSALLREIKEETGIEASIRTLIDVVDGIFFDANDRVEYHYTMIDYLAEWNAGDVRAGDDALNASWFARAELKGLDLWSETERVINKAFELVDGRS